MAKFKNLDDFTALFKQVKPIKNGEYQALCPAHNDRLPSLHIKQVDNKILINCKAGCETTDIIKALGLRMSDLFLADNRPPQRTIKATYDYKDETGNLLFQVVRYEPKSFSQRRPDGSGKWINNLNGITPVLYHLPEILQAKYTERIYIVEGEKDADRLGEYGFFATCNPMGAGKWRPQYTECLTNAKEVVIIPDNDNEGKKHAANIAQALLSKVNRIKCLELPGDNVKDVSDWFNIHNDFDKFLEIVEQTPEYNQHSEYLSQLVRLDTVDPVEIQWLWKPYIPRNYLTLLEGDPGGGKSTVSLAIGGAISTGANILGNQFPQGNVLVLSAEDGNADVIVPRLIKMGANRKRIFTPKELLTIDDAGISLLTNLIRSINPMLVIIDPLVAYLSGDMDMNQANQVRHILKQLAEIAEIYHTSILCLRHVGKSKGRNPLYGGLGSIDFTAAARSVIVAAIYDEDTSENLLLHIKCNLAKKGSTISYKLDETNALLWNGFSDLKYQDLAEVNTSSTVPDIKAWLEEELLDGERLASELLETSDKRGYSRASLNRAKKSLNVITFNKAEQGKKGAGKWYWKIE